LTNEKIIEVSGLTKRFKELTAVDNLALNVYKGDVFGFLGPNGAGKSTTIRMLLSLIRPTKGEIKLFGKSLKKSRLEILRNVGSIVEKPDFYLFLSAYKNLEILGNISRTDVSKKRILDVLELVGLQKRHASKVKTYSHGMKQRLGLAQALLHNPELIILDEPTTGLDPQGIKEIRELIIHLSKDLGKTILLSSHILKEVELISNRMIILNKGKTVVEGSVEELMKSELMSVEIEVDDLSKASSIVSLTGWADKIKETKLNKLVFEIDKSEIAGLNKYLVDNDINVSSIVPIRSLEDYFLKITGENE
jgi:ABC-2 type transport system ATP-binding protein